MAALLIWEPNCLPQANEIIQQCPKANQYDLFWSKRNIQSAEVQLGASTAVAKFIDDTKIIQDGKNQSRP